MPKEENKDLLEFLLPFPPGVQEKALWLRDFIWDMYPKTNELIYDNYNAVAIGWSPTEKLSHIFCSIAVYRTNNAVHFGFYWGAEIPDPEKLLLGTGKQYRYILVNNMVAFPVVYVKQLLHDAYENSFNKIKDHQLIVFGKTITKSISEVKRVKKTTSSI